MVMFDQLMSEMSAFTPVEVAFIINVALSTKKLLEEQQTIVMGGCWRRKGWVTLLLL